MIIKAEFLLKNLSLQALSREGVPEEWIEYVRKRCTIDMRDHYFFWEAYQLLDLLERAGVKSIKGFKILDAGCGFGVVDCLLTMMGGDLTLLDYDMGYINKSIEPFHDLAKSAKFIKGDILKMPFKGEKFDLVWNGGVVEHFEKPSEAIKKMALLTKPDGYVFVSVPALLTPHTFIVRPYRRRIKNFYFDTWGKEKSYTEKGLTEEMKEAGLMDIITSTCNLRRTFVDDYVVMPRLKKYIPTSITRILNLSDWLEMNIPILHCFGFTVGAIGRK
ncbi:MAG: class I SAM-dependent methyltransferase [Nitrospinae bacterium]|nr:class I SAM-dependent methyltransferase [Nitrospinota bacterium]